MEINEKVINLDMDGHLWWKCDRTGCKYGGNEIRYGWN